MNATMEAKKYVHQAKDLFKESTEKIKPNISIEQATKLLYVKW